MWELTVTSLAPFFFCAVGRRSLCGTAGRSGPGPRAAMPRGDEESHSQSLPSVARFMLRGAAAASSLRGASGSE